MPIYALADVEPDIHSQAFVHPDAVIIGNVVIGAEASIWPGAVLRGDGGGVIEIGPRTSIQDNSVLHTTPQHPTLVGAGCLVGHLVHLEGCRLEDGSMVGNGAIVLHGVVVRTGAIVAANAVVLDGVEVPGGAIALGIPAKIREGAARQATITQGVAAYVERAAEYHRALRRIG